MRLASRGVPWKRAFPGPYVNILVHKGREDTVSLHSHSLTVTNQLFLEPKGRLLKQQRYRLSRLEGVEEGDHFGWHLAFLFSSQERRHCLSLPVTQAL